MPRFEGDVFRFGTAIYTTPEFVITGLLYPAHWQRLSPVLALVRAYTRWFRP